MKKHIAVVGSQTILKPAEGTNSVHTESPDISASIAHHAGNEGGSNHGKSSELHLVK